MYSILKVYNIGRTNKRWHKKGYKSGHPIVFYNVTHFPKTSLISDFS